MQKSDLHLLGLVAILSSSKLYAQEESAASTIPVIQQKRAEESYAFHDGNDSAKLFLKRLKWIPISRKNNFFFTLGGQYRPRFEYFSNVDYTSEVQF